MRKSLLTSRKKAKLIAKCAYEKKADNIVVLDMRKSAKFCDYFVICSGTSDRRIRAIADAIKEGLEELGLRIYSKQGFRRANWIVLDCSDVVAHVFNAEVRDFYSLERLWRDAPQVSWKK